MHEAKKKSPAQTTAIHTDKTLAHHTAPTRLAFVGWVFNLFHQAVTFSIHTFIHSQVRKWRERHGTTCREFVRCPDPLLGYV